MAKCVTYLRLSKEDDRCMDESNSIKNQRDLIRKHIRGIPELKKMEQVELSDDGYSGKNMDRPGMQELLKLIRENRVGAIVVKDISRFSREHLETGKYLEQIFPFMGVRFIAINDNYDSNDYVGGIGEIDVAFKRILYDFYSEDLSEKVTTAMRARHEQGKYLGSLPPYGYKKSPDDKNKLIVDDEAAAIVKRIFSDYLNGGTVYGIAQTLNSEGIETRAEYFKRTVGYSCQKKTDAVKLWTTNAISNILQNEYYIGTMIYHKYEQTEVAGKAKKVLDRDEWERIEKHHEAIISKKDFKAAGEKLLRNRKVRTTHPAHVLSRKVFCGICKHGMCHSRTGRDKFECAHTYLDKGNWHERNSILDTEIETAVLGAIQKEFNVQAETKKLAEEKRLHNQGKVAEAEKRLEDMQTSLDKLYADQMEAFESYKSGMTSKELFLEQKSAYEQMEGRLQENIQKQMQAISMMEDKLDESDKGIILTDEQITATKLTKELVDMFVERINVWPGNKIEIVWKIKR